MASSSVALTYSLHACQAYSETSKRPKRVACEGRLTASMGAHDKPAVKRHCHQGNVLTKGQDSFPNQSNRLSNCSLELLAHSCTAMQSLNMSINTKHRGTTVAANQGDKLQKSLNGLRVSVHGAGTLYPAVADLHTKFRRCGQ